MPVDVRCLLHHLLPVVVESLHVPGAPATRYDGVDARHGTADQRSQNQTGKNKMNLINERRIKACMGRFDARSYIRLSIILQLQEVYTTYLAAVTCILPLFWKELHTALYCNLFSNDVLQFNVRHFHVRHFQSTHRNDLSARQFIQHSLVALYCKYVYAIIVRVLRLNCIVLRITPDCDYT